MTACAIGEGSTSKSAGVKLFFGHGIIEIPLMILLFSGLNFLESNIYLKNIIGIAGGVVLIYFAADMFRNVGVDYTSGGIKGKSVFFQGIVLTLFNPYFLIWWATIGCALVIRSKEFGITGFVLLIVFHSLCDAFWLSFLSIASNKGSDFFGKNFKKVVFIICGILLISVGIKFICDFLFIMVKNKFFN